MKLLSEQELRMNQDASTIAASVLSEPVEAASRCEQVTTDMAAEAAGVSAINRGMMRGMKAMMGATTSVGRMGKGLETGGLPKSFVLAVTASQVYAIEDKHDGERLVAGKVLNSWARDGFRASLSPSVAQMAQGVPEDRQILVLYLPIEGGNNRYLQAAGRNTAQTGGMPHRFMVANDAPSQGVIDALVTQGAGAVPNIIVGGQRLEDMVAQAQAQAAAGAAAPVSDPTERLGKLAELHKQGVLTDEEFATQKAKLLSEM